MNKPWDLRERTILFSVNVIQFVRTLPHDAESAEIASQLRRSSSSIGAHLAAAKRNKSDKDYINKISGGIEEGDESLYWFDVLIGAEICSEDSARELRAEANELVSILVASRTTAIERQARNKKLQAEKKAAAPRRM